MNEYTRRINRVIDYIDRNLANPLTIEELADVANFSKFHFHRIFSTFMREPLYAYILRIRLEKAAHRLYSDKKRPVTDIALSAGFSSASVFARAFKERFGMSASEWRQLADVSMEMEDSKIRQTNGKESEAAFAVSTHFNRRTGKPTWRLTKMDQKSMEVEVRTETIKDLPVAYVRYVGPYQGDESLFERLFGQLMQWAGPRGVVREDTLMMTLYHDDPSLTDGDKLRISVCMTVPPETEVEGEIGKMEIKGGQYAIGEFLIRGDEYAMAWKAMYGDWLPQSGYMPDDRLPFERYLNNPDEHPDKKHHFEIWVPIVPI